MEHPVVLKETIREMNDKGLTAYIIFLDIQKQGMARCHPIYPPYERNKGQKSKNGRKN